MLVKGALHHNKTRNGTNSPYMFAREYCIYDIFLWHHNDVIMGALASQVTSLTIVYPTVYSGAGQTSTLRVTGLCAGNSPMTGVFPAQMASNAENDSIWRHNDLIRRICPTTCLLSTCIAAKCQVLFLHKKNTKHSRKNMCHMNI